MTTALALSLINRVVLRRRHCQTQACEMVGLGISTALTCFAALVWVLSRWTRIIDRAVRLRALALVLG